jgi:signal transduction histidine kinase
VHTFPKWAAAAFITRCARRYADPFAEDATESSVAKTAVTEAIALSEIRTDLGEYSDAAHRASALNHPALFNSNKVESIHRALKGHAAALNSEFDEIGHIRKRTSFVAIQLALLALEATFPKETGSSGFGNIDLAIELASSGEIGVAEDVQRDLATLKERVEEFRITDDHGVSQETFGPLWPNGRPATWPTPRLRFRPRARIIRTIGDRLISGPEAAVIELVKNSYDADATRVKITLIPPLIRGQGEILFEDDGHGMTLADIQEKWMEPATNDKKQRKESPGGRRLLGSKGIGRFAAARLGERLDLVSTARNGAPPHTFEKTRIAELDWSIFEQSKYLDDIEFNAETEITQGPDGTSLRISRLRDDWNGLTIKRLKSELRRLVSPIERPDKRPFKIFLDLSKYTNEHGGFDGSIFWDGQESKALSSSIPDESYEIKPFPVLEACDYAVDGVFDEQGTFDGTMTIRAAGAQPESIKLSIPLEKDHTPCGIVLVRLSIFDRESSAIRSTAEKAGFGYLGIREARKLLDSIAGVTIYREGFRVRPYGDPENDWLTLDMKRVQNPSQKIGHNQISGVIVVDDEESSNLIERSSREGLEENGSFRRLQHLVLRLLSEVVEPRRRKYRFSSGIEAKRKSGFNEALSSAELLWTKPLLEKIPENDRADVKKLISIESEKLSSHLKDLQERQTQLGSQATLGLLVGELMHQGNTPLAFIESETRRLSKWWGTIFDDTEFSAKNRDEIPRIVNGMAASASSLRILFNALSPLAGARRGEPAEYRIKTVIDNTIYLFKSKADAASILIESSHETPTICAKGYPQDLTTALTNLIDNAIHWLQSRHIKPAIILISTAQLTDSKVRITVEDNGFGIPHEFRELLFDIGFTLKPNGTGLGLSIAREAIFRSGGELYLDDSIEGAKFSIVLPNS